MLLMIAGGLIQQFFDTSDVQAGGTFQSGTDRIINDFEFGGHRIKPGCLRQIQNYAVGSSRKVIHKRMPFVPVGTKDRRIANDFQCLSIHLQFLMRKHPVAESDFPADKVQAKVCSLNFVAIPNFVPNFVPELCPELCRSAPIRTIVYDKVYDKVYDEVWFEFGIPVLPKSCQTAVMNPPSVSLTLVLSLLLLGTSLGHATILTFEDFTGNNSHVNTVANPFGAGQYGSRAASVINAGFQAGDGFTPNVVLTWGIGWQTYTGWPFGNNASTNSNPLAMTPPAIPSPSAASPKPTR